MATSTVPARLPVRWSPFRYHAAQQALWRCQKRFCIVPAGRGSGKTELAKRKLVVSLLARKDWPDARYFYSAPTERQAKRIAWRDLLMLVPKQWVPRGGVNHSELYIRTVFGSELWIIGLDKPQRIEGVQWDGGVIDESCDVKPKTFDLNILPTLVWRNGWCWRIGVPKRQGVGASEFRRAFNDALDGKTQDAAAFTWPSKDILSPEALLYAQEHMDPKDYREQFDAKFETAGGLVFYAFQEDYNIRACSFDPQRPLIVGSDFNVDPMAWVIGHATDERIEWFDELWMRDCNTQRALDALWQKYGRVAKAGIHFYGDATSKARKTSAALSDYQLILTHPRFKEAGSIVRYPPANPALRDRVAACNAMFCNARGERRCFIDPRCVHLIDDLETRSYKPGTNEPDDAGDVGHATDALGYAIHRMFPVRVRLQTASSHAVTVSA